MSLIDTDGRSARLRDPGAELRHDHRVGAEVVEEVAVDRHLLHAQDVGEHLGEAALRLRGRNEHGPVAGGPDQVHGQHLLMVVGHSELLNQVGVVAWLAAKGLWCRHPSRL